MSQTTISHLEEWLDSTRDINQMEPAQRTKFLKLARGVVMEALVALKPAETMETERPGVVEKPSNIEGIGTHHTPIFDVTTDTNGWQFGMLGAINTAKKMGTENFEIVVKQEKSKKPQQRQHPFYFGPPDMDEAWRYSGEEAGVCWRVTIYAVRIK